MAESPLPIRVAQTIGLTTASTIAGVSFAISALLVPRILESPTPLLLQQWKHSFVAGKKSLPPLAGLSSASFFYLAYKAHGTPTMLPRKWQLYLASGLLAVGIVPYTLLIMAPTNNKLLAKAEETSGLGIEDKIVEIGLGGETAHKLVDDWATLNVGRAFMLGLAAVIGTWNALG